VCFDVDCTCTTTDSLDLLAEFMGVGRCAALVVSRHKQTSSDNACIVRQESSSSAGISHGSDASESVRASARPYFMLAASILEGLKDRSLF